MQNNLDIAISLTCYKRLDYLTRVINSLLDSLQSANAMNTKVYISIDYHDDAIYRYISSLNLDKTIIVNKPSIGCNANTEQAIRLALNRHDATIHLEDDTVLAKDGIAFYTTMLNEYKDHPQIISVGGYNKTINLNPTEYDQVFTDCGFVCWGCAFWKHKSEPILTNWTTMKNASNNTISWDTHLNKNVFQKLKYLQVRPMISRIQNIGVFNGTWTTSDEDWHNKNHRTPYTSDDVLSCKKL
jgi:hypothetical protein